MTTFAAPPSREERMRSVVSVVAVLCAVAVSVGDVLLVLSFKREPSWWAGWGLVLLAWVVAVGCLRHGARHEHERGRWPAVVAVLLGLPMFIFATYGAGTHGCQTGPALYCVDIGRDADR